DRALNPESGGGFYFDLASAQQSAVPDWLGEAAASLERGGEPVVLEKTAKVLDNLAGVAGYANQGSNDKVLADQIPKIQWKRGAIATVFDKFTAVRFRAEPNEASDAGFTSLSARYIQSGATGFGGYVADPTLDGFLRPQILFPAYASGHNLAESFYAASRYLSWQLVVVGDPLTSPFGENLAARRN